MRYNETLKQVQGDCLTFQVMIIRLKETVL